MITTFANLRIEVLDMNSTMPRPPSDRTFQVAFKIPEEWVTKADALAEKLSTPAMRVTRTDVLRQALYAGLESLDAPKTKSRK
jgi:hypothetical protein